MRIIFLMLLLTRFGASLTTQHYAIYDAFGELVETQIFDQDGNLTARTIFILGTPVRSEAQTFEEDQLVRRVTTHHIEDPPYDIIEEWTYDGKILVNKLYGNNRTGRWSSEGYEYDRFGNLKTINHYRKNGFLAYQTQFECAYDEVDRLILKNVKKIVFPTDSLHDDWENEVAIGKHQVPPEGEYSSLNRRHTYAYDEQGNLMEEKEYDHLNRLILEKTYRYSPSGKTEVLTAYKDDGSMSFSERSTYNMKGQLRSTTLGKLVTKTSYFANGVPKVKTTLRNGKVVSKRTTRILP